MISMFSRLSKYHTTSVQDSITWLLFCSVWTGGDNLSWSVEIQLNWSRDRWIQSYLKKTLMMNIPTIELVDLCSKPHMKRNIILKQINLWCDLVVCSKRVMFWIILAWTKNNSDNALNKIFVEKSNHGRNQPKLMNRINILRMYLLSSRNHVPKSLEFPECSWVKIKRNKTRVILLLKELIYGFQNIQNLCVTRNLNCNLWELKVLLHLQAWQLSNQIR